MQSKLAEEETGGALTQRQAVRAVRQRNGKSTSKSRTIRQTFVAENGVRITVTANRQSSFHEVLAALQETVEEVQLRIDNNVQLY